jgi:ATP-dependent helicase/nuclease subunit A
VTQSASANDDATLAQIRAADPANSTWVSANAGSGKTRVLTDRVARLLLQNVPPQKILCLTYTKAAASNMQNQLFDRLGKWAMLGDSELRKQLADLGLDAGELDAGFLSHARTLFASALETPGGLKIQTIHSFCAALLRRFPLEAGVSPQFQEIDDRSGKKLRADILDTLAEGANPVAFDGMARYLSGDDPDKLASEIARNRDAFLPFVSEAEIWDGFDLSADFSEADAPALALDGSEAALFKTCLPVLHTFTSTMQTLATKLGGLNLTKPDQNDLDTLFDVFLFKSGDNIHTPKYKSAITKKAAEALGDLMPDMVALMDRVSAAKASLLTLAAARKTLALHRFAQVFLPEYDRAKQVHGWLDFDDLILKARGLLTESSMAQWVLFKLDGGIDHILVDEAQDTSPEQWAVIARLAEEFLAGQGAREINRTLFVVGDEKQSIYSFQGADPAAFARMRDHFKARLAEAERHLNQRELLFSFRSSTAILRLVDMVVKNDMGANLTSEVSHRAFHASLPGRVDLWPFLEKEEAAKRPVWHEPLDMPLPDDPAIRLAAQVADAIKAVLDEKQTIPTTKGTRLIAPGDFLILVQRRSDVFHEIIRTLKDRGLPVAGADRLKIGGELAVRDLTALLSFMTTPEDDLSLAAALRSPLFGLTEQDLFRLAHGRNGSLWQELRHQKDVYPQVFDDLNALLKQADFLRPYELLERILTGHQGREQLIARLGHEAEDGIDALLTQALQYEQMEPPSLTGFLGWMATDESDIKRQMDTQSGEIRVMTVHGAKGLESPIVILPDTAKRMPPQSGEILRLENGQAAWRTNRDESPPAMKDALEARKQFQEQERMRLLYVAMTRAENWLIVCGSGTKGEAGESWYTHVEAGLEQTGAQDALFQGQTIQRFEPLGWQGTPMVDAAKTARPVVVLPDWARLPAPKAADKPSRLNPSDLGGAKVVDGGADGLDEQAALSRGRQIHALLEHLAGSDPTDWPRLAPLILRAGADPADAAQTSALLAEVSQILSSPELAMIFAPGTLAEVKVTADLKGLKMDGVIDRLVVSDTRVLAVDFKSNAVVPMTPDLVPDGLLRQMGAYAMALAQIYPGHQIETAILWTKTSTLMSLSHETVTQAFENAPAS